jgi:hypothetical protein
MTDQTVPTPLAWYSNPDLKAEVMERLRAHRAEDSIVQGLYQQTDPEAATGYRGCCIGCTLPKLSVEERYHLDRESEDTGRGGWWVRIERQYGIDYWVANLIDRVFESQQDQAAGAFAVAVVNAIPVGADLTAVFDAWRDAQMDDAEPAAAARWLIDALNNAPAPVPAGV